MDTETQNTGETQQVESIKAETVNVSGQVREITAQTVTLQNGGVGTIKGETVTTNVTNGGIGAVMAQKADVTINQGGIGAVLAREATVKSASIAFVAAEKISGDAKILFDLRAGVVAGITMGVVLGLFRLIARRCCR